MIVTLCAGACPPVTLALGGLPADLATVDRLLRLLLEARRSRIAVRLEAAADDAWELLDLLGVSHLLRGPPGECRPEGQDPSRGGSPYSPNRSG